MASLLASTVRVAAAAFLALLAAGAAYAHDADELAARYAAWRAAVAGNASGPGLAIASAEDGGRMRGDIDGLVNARFDALASHLASARDWCDIALLHFNVKACTHGHDASGDTVTFYSGGKYFEPARRARAMRYVFRVASQRPGYVAVELTAASGPLGTRDYAIVVEAEPAGAQTFVHLRYAYRPSASSRFATGAYLATAGSGKKGFSIAGRDANGRPIYVGGVRGIVERNAVRNFLAIQAFVDSLDAAKRDAEAKFERWFDLTERYPEQLHELDRDAYLAIKAQEERQTLALQQAVDAGDATP